VNSPSAIPDPAARPPRAMLVSVAAAVVACVLAAPYRTENLGIPARTLFWAVLIGFNAFKWWAWYRVLASLVPNATVAARVGVAVAGAVLLNASLPFEIAWLFAAIGQDVAPAWAPTFLAAALISLATSSVIAVIGDGQGAVLLREAATVPVPAAEAPTGLAARAGRADWATLLAVTAEDHYVRLHLADGKQPLILYRFSDALAELAGMEGLQVHRGAWVAGHGVAGAVREGRRWRLRLANGAFVPVSDAHLAAVRGRGWLKPSA